MNISNIQDIIRLPFRKERELYTSLYHILGFYPRNIQLYKTAFMHKSMTRRKPGDRDQHRSDRDLRRSGGRNGGRERLENNERLEFLGDAILDAVVGDIVFRHFKTKREGFLTNARSKIVKRETLGRLAKTMGLDKFIRCSQRNNTHNSFIGGNAFEALIGAIYLDRGYAMCMAFMQKRILKELINVDKVAYKEVNFKSKLLEWCQKNRVKLTFSLKSQKRDKDDSPVFCFKTIIEGIEVSEAEGFSKKESQQNCARLALEKLRKDVTLLDNVFYAKSQRTKMEETPVSVAPAVEPVEQASICSVPEGDTANGKAETKEQPCRAGIPACSIPEGDTTQGDTAQENTSMGLPPQSRWKPALQAAPSALAETKSDEVTATAEASDEAPTAEATSEVDEFDLSDISHAPLSEDEEAKQREAIIQKALEEAYGE